jgi:hypothetical protein
LEISGLPSPRQVKASQGWLGIQVFQITERHPLSFSGISRSSIHGDILGLKEKKNKSFSWV